MDDSTNLRAPGFGPTLPIYPHLRQIVRVTGRAGPVYTGYVQQWDGVIGNFRDREPCYVYEPNGIEVANATVKGRLNGSHTGAAGTLPLYVTTLACCVAISSSSSSSSSVSVSSRSPSSPSLSPSSSPSPSSVSAVSAPSSSISSSSQVCCLGPCPRLYFNLVSGIQNPPQNFYVCLTRQPDGSLVGSFNNPALGGTYTFVVRGDCGPANQFNYTVTGPGGSNTVFADGATDCANIPFGTITLRIATYTVTLIDDRICCSSTSSSSPSSVSSPSSPSAASPVSSVSAASIPGVSSSVSSAVCCPNLPPQLGLYLTCAGAVSASSIAFQPPPNPIPPGPIPGACNNCTDGTPGYWTFQAMFGGIFTCFNGLWTLLQSPTDPCTWTSDPTDVCYAKLFVSIDPSTGDCLWKLSLFVRGAEFATYKASPASCACCEPIKMELTSLLAPGAPDLLTIVPWDCQPVGISSASAVSSVSSCSCQPCDVCLTEQDDGSYTGEGCDASFQLVCVAQGNGVNDYELLVTIDGVTETYQAQPGSSCDPFQGLFFNIIGTCGEWHAVVNTNAAPCSSSSSSSSVSSSSPSSSSSSPSSSPSSLSSSSMSSSSVSSSSSAQVCCLGPCPRLYFNLVSGIQNPPLNFYVCLTRQPDGSLIGSFTNAALGGTYTFVVRGNCGPANQFNYTVTGPGGTGNPVYASGAISCNDIPFDGSIVLRVGTYTVTLIDDRVCCSSSSSSSSVSPSSASPSSVSSASPSSIVPSSVSPSSVPSPSSVASPAASSSSSSEYGSILTGCCPNKLPATLELSLSAIGGCPLNGATATLVYQNVGPSGNAGWSGRDNSTCDLLWELFCQAGDWAIVVYKNPPIPCAVTQSGPTVNCGPPFNFSITLTNFPSNCCASCSTVIVTIQG